ncbi:unnamed protein product [Closterium sp. NIES-65]|nr:unnamed protein product [Closterium sp. NIES-65]
MTGCHVSFAGRSAPWPGWRESWRKELAERVRGGVAARRADRGSGAAAQWGWGTWCACRGMWARGRPLSGAPWHLLMRTSCRAYPCRAYPCRAYPCRAYPCHAYPCRAYPCRAYPCRAYPCRAYSCRACTHVVARALTCPAWVPTPCATQPFLRTCRPPNPSSSRHLIRALTGDPHLIVTSPTFLLLNSYPSPALTVHHYDAYRLGALRTATPAPAAAAAAAAESPDIQRLDLAHSLATGLCLIEWPQPLLPLLPAHRLHLSISLLPPAPHPPGGTHEPDVLPMGRPTAGVTGGAAEGRAETGEEMIGGEEGREGGKRGAEDGEEWEEQGGWEHEEEEDAEGEWWRVVHLDASGEPWTAVIDAVVASARLSPLVTIL